MNIPSSRDGDGVVDDLVQQPGRERFAHDQSAAKGLRVLPHRRGSGDVLPYSQLLVDPAQARHRTVLGTWSYPLRPSRFSRFYMTLLNGHHFRQDLSPTSGMANQPACAYNGLGCWSMGVYTLDMPPWSGSLSTPGSASPARDRHQPNTHQQAVKKGWIGTWE